MISFTAITNCCTSIRTRTRRSCWAGGHTDHHRADRRLLRAAIALSRSTQQGKQLLIARRLVERGVRFVQVWHDGWDHHQDLEDRITAKAGEMAKQAGAATADAAKQAVDATAAAAQQAADAAKKAVEANK